MDDGLGGSNDPAWLWMKPLRLSQRVWEGRERHECLIKEL